MQRCKHKNPLHQIGGGFYVAGFPIGSANQAPVKLKATPYKCVREF